MRDAHARLDAKTLRRASKHFATASAVAVSAVAMALPASANAETWVGYYTTPFEFLAVAAEPGNENDINVSIESDHIYVSDSGDTVTAADERCEQDGDNAVRCEVTEEQVVWVGSDDENDVVSVDGSSTDNAVIAAEAGEGDDSLTGSTSYDFFDGQSGADTLEGGEGDDELTGGAGIDSLAGGGGDDTLKARDELSDQPLECGVGTDSVVADALPFDPITVEAGCESVERPTSTVTPPAAATPQPSRTTTTVTRATRTQPPVAQKRKAKKAKKAACKSKKAKRKSKKRNKKCRAKKRRR